MDVAHPRRHFKLAGERDAYIAHGLRHSVAIDHDETTFGVDNDAGAVVMRDRKYPDTV